MYFTSSIPYVNAPPHIGHALEFIQADVLARYYKLAGKDVILQTGTDENAFKNVLAAKKLGIPTQELVDRNAGIFKDLISALNVEADAFIRTTEDRHHQTVKTLWSRLKPHDIYRKKYQGLYCDGCEDFYQEKDLVDGLCPDHQSVPRPVEEENIFFRLSSYQEKLKDLIESGRLKITPEKRKPEILAFINRGLQDISVSRSAERAGGWGIKVPGDDSQVIYVWIDALVNYISGQNKLFEEILEDHNSPELSQSNYNTTWTEQNQKIHVIGKNIWKFHAIYWPALLLSAEWPLPNELVIHGFLTSNGKKVGKSLGNAIDPFEFIQKYGSDGFRHYLTTLSPFDDGDFTAERIQTVYIKDCANTLGNVVKRITTLAQSDGCCDSSPRCAGMQSATG